MRTKKRDYEKLTEANISHVIELLEAEKPITKKQACEILNITYNTTRLANIIKEHKEDIEYKARRKAEKKGTGATEDEIKYVAQSYIDGDNVSDIAKGIFRSPSFVRGIIERLGIPKKYAQTDYDGIRNSVLPDQCVSDTFEEGEIVWARKKNYPAIVIREHIECTDLSETLFPQLEFAGGYHSCMAYDIGSLRHLEKYVNVLSK
jgi:transposase